jgi:phosphoenolpyruvate carboxykinase (ATP)
MSKVISGNKVKMIEETLKRGLGSLSSSGALIVNTGKFTGRATKEKYFVDRPEVSHQIDWSPTNQPLSLETSKEIFSRLERKIQGTQNYQMKGFVGTFGIQVTSLSPWHIAFAENMFRAEAARTAAGHSAYNGRNIQVLHDPYGRVSDLGVKHPHETLILLDAHDLKIAIIGTAYAGEIKKGAFTLCNFELPETGVLPMHASANCLSDGSNSCVLFGLSGTGKTTLSASSDRALIGDDEIIWTTTGMSNLEGGCYAKLIDLSAEKEPEIYRAVNQFGSIMENVGYDESTRIVDFTDVKKTENTRASYCMNSLGSVFQQEQEAKPASTIIFLTADAFGAMPAVAKLDEWQTQYHFISGYTAKVAGTEIGVKEPTAAFSACFGAPFMPRHASVYAKLLMEYAKRHGSQVWLVNTGWTKGGYGKGERFPIKVSRTIISAIQNGTLQNHPRVKHPVFGFEVPTECPGVDAEYLKIPTGEGVTELARKFVTNMARFADRMDHRVTSLGGPIL